MTSREDTTRFAVGGETVVRRLGFGAMRITGKGIWGPPADRAVALALLRRALEIGVELIDTADAYGPDVSELLIAEALYPYDGLLIATKGGFERTGPSGRSKHGELLGWSHAGRPEQLRAACEGSLRRLRVDRIDLYQLHWPDPDVQLEESIGAMKELQEEGKVLHVGVCNVTVEQLAIARSPVILPIPGTTSVAHLKENVAAASLRLDAEEMKAIGSGAG